MFDLKTFGKNDQEQTSLLTIVKGFSDDIQMEFGLEKCSKATFKKGKLTTTENIQIDLDTTIQQLEQEGTYKYLGVNKGDGIQHAKMKEKIKKEYYRRIRMITKSELNAINRMEAINPLATPVVTYSFNIVDWKIKEIRKLDRKTRKLLTMERMHHPRADVDRMYLPRNKSGRGLIQLEIAYKTATIGLDAYLNAAKNDPLLVIAKEHEKAKKKYSVASQATVFRRELHLPEALEPENEVPTVYARNVKQKAKHQAQVQLKQKLEDKSMRGPSNDQ